MKISYSRLIPFVLLLTCLISVISVALSSYNVSFKKIQTLTGEKLKHISSTGSLIINPDSHKRILEDLIARKDQIEETESFKEVQAQLRKIKNVNGLKQDIYTVVMVDGLDDVMIFIAMSNKDTYVGNAMKLHPLVKKAYLEKSPQFSDIYKDHEGEWISGFAPIFDKNKNVIGVIEVDFDVRVEVANLRIELIKSLVLPIALIFISIILISFFLSRTITGPIESLLDEINSVASMNYEPKKSGSSYITELDILGKRFEEMTLVIAQARKDLRHYADNLEIKVEERTRELEESRKNIANILNNLSQGFLTFNKTGKTGNDYSRIVERLFGKSPKGRYFNDLICGDVSFSEQDFDDWRSLAYSGAVEFDSLVDLLPNNFVNNTGRYINLNYRKITNNDGHLEEVICIAEDKTKEIELIAKASQKEDYASFILHLTKYSNFFIEYCDNFEKNIKQLMRLLSDQNFNIDNVDAIMRILHTVKGESAYNYVTSVSKTTQLAEDIGFKLKQCIANDQKEFLYNKQQLIDGVTEIQRNFENFINKNKTIINSQISKSEKVSRSRQDLEDLINKMKFTDMSSTDIVNTFERYLLQDDVSSMFKKYEELVNDLAQKQDKKIDFHIQSNGIRVDYKKYQSLSSAFVHIVRNAVDHGIESIQERTQKGKNPIAKVNVEFSQYFKDDHKYLKLKIMDDGRGIDFSKLVKSAFKKNISDRKQTGQYSESELHDLIFKPGLSSRDEINEISGRGIGMDAVKYEVEKLNGFIDVQSVVDEGTTFIINLPML